MTYGGQRPPRRRLRAKPRALLIDLDGVVRTFDPAWNAAVEAKHGLRSGALWDVIFEPERLLRAVTGAMTNAEWMAEVASDLGSAEAVCEWETYRGDIDADVMEMVREVRAAGFPVALGTNATDRLDEDLAFLGVAGSFDAVVNASVIGAAKPHPAFFAAACAALDVSPAETLFVDDTPRHVAGARAAGLVGLRYTGHDDLAYVRAAFGVGVEPSRSG